MKYCLAILIISNILCGCVYAQHSEYTPLPGSAISLSNAVSECKSAYIAQLVSLGIPGLDSPGAWNYNSEWIIKRTLKGNDPQLAHVTLAFRVVKFPETLREVEPVIGKVYFLFSRPEYEFHIQKICAYTTSNIRQVEAFLEKLKEIEHVPPGGRGEAPRP